MGLVKHLAKEEDTRRRVQQGLAQKPYRIGKNWITRFLNRHPNLAIKLVCYVVELTDNVPLQGTAV